jgi:hypothetical protein
MIALGARRPGRDIWVWCGDLPPEATRILEKGRGSPPRFRHRFFEMVSPNAEDPRSGGRGSRYGGAARCTRLQFADCRYP